MSFLLHQHEQDLYHGYFSSFSALPVIHGISTRTGGVSAVPYAQLNLGLHIGDDPVAVRRNRQLFCRALGVNADKLTTAEQIHGAGIAVIDHHHAGSGANCYAEAIPATDALITNVPGIPLMLFYADCVPIFIVDPVNVAVGVVHAGWKGTVAKIAVQTLQSMQRHFASEPAQCLVGIGPSIGPCCYEVDETVASQWRRNFTDWTTLLTARTAERWMLDLWRSNRVQLEEIGVPAENITVSSVCTACHTSRYFSHRSEQGHTGRHGALIALRESH